MTTSVRAIAGPESDGGRVRAEPLPRRRPAFAAAALRATVALFDALIVALAFLCATALADPRPGDAEELPGRLLVVCAASAAGLALQRAYELGRVRNGHQMLTRLVLGAITGLALTGLACFALPRTNVDRHVFAVHAALAVPLLLVWRRTLFHALREAALRPRAVVLGEVGLARKVAHALSSARFCGSEVLGILGPDGAVPGDGGPGAEIPRLGGYERLRAVCAAHDVEQAIVVAGSNDERLPVDDLLALRRGGLSVEEGPGVYEAVTGKLLVEKLTPGWLVFANAFEPSKAEAATRRALGVVVAGAALVLLAPLLGLVALLIRLDSPGPIFFRQDRTGEGGRLFELIKFRTMRRDAEAESGPVWARARDPRVTRLGRILRRTRLDELPQLWNVLRGDMYFVGPRPERPHFVALLRERVPHYDQRHAVKPGITGWAQINYRYGATVEDAVEKLHYDLFYIQNMSLLLDLYIVLGTARVMLGASNEN